MALNGILHATVYFTLNAEIEISIQQTIAGHVSPSMYSGQALKKQRELLN